MPQALLIQYTLCLGGMSQGSSWQTSCWVKIKNEQVDAGKSSYIEDICLWMNYYRTGATSDQMIICTDMSVRVGIPIIPVECR
jgi:hypothetical protein